MARTRKKTTRDRLIEAALYAAPAPIRTVASNPLGFRLLMIAAAGLMATGILTLDWQDGVPHFNFNREKAKEVRQELVQDLGRQVQHWEQGQGINPHGGIPQDPHFANANPPGYFIQAPNTQGYQQPQYQQPFNNYPQVPGSNGGWGQPANGIYNPNTGTVQPQYGQGGFGNAQYPQGQVPQGGYAPGQYPLPGTGGYPQQDYRR